jgi:hypothetical protein
MMSFALRVESGKLIEATPALKGADQPLIEGEG